MESSEIIRFVGKMPAVLSMAASGALFIQIAGCSTAEPEQRHNMGTAPGTAVETKVPVMFRTYVAYPDTKAGEKDFIYVKSDYKLVQIRLDDILYIEGLKDYLKIYLESEPRPVLTLASMRNMEERLPSPRFMRVHRSYIVQMSKVKTLDKGQIVFGKTRIPISDTYKAGVSAYLDKYTL